MENQSQPILIKDLGRKHPKATSKQKTRYGLYKCFCGNEFETQAHHIKTGHTKSCGCLRVSIASNKFKTHNLANHRLYSIWSNIKNRCYNKNSINYNRYGQKGIVVCDEWLNNFMSFYNWAMSNGYEDGLTIDRKDNMNGYAPSNCRWVNAYVQNANKGKQITNTSGYKGVHFRKNRNIWVARITVNHRKIQICSSNDKKECAVAYNQYIIKNNLPHELNII